MKTQTHFTSIGLSILFVLITCVNAWAGPSAYRAAMRKQALQTGFPTETIFVLKPEPGIGRNAMASKLLNILDGRLGQRFVAKDFSLKEQKDASDITLYMGKRGYLEIEGDGSKFRYRGDIDNPGEIARNRNKGQMRDQKIERLGRNLIESLNDLIQLGPNEKLIFLGTKFLKDGGAAINQGTNAPDARSQINDETIANIALFGREVNGIPVISRGSKIAVWFDNSGECVAIDVDWPVYKISSQKQDVLRQTELTNRIETVKVQSENTADVSLDHMECGYVDLGVRRRGAPIQSGCLVFYKTQQASDKTPNRIMQSGRMKIIPAAKEIIEDPKWTLASDMAKASTLESTSEPESETTSESYPLDTSGKSTGCGLTQH